MPLHNFCRPACRLQGALRIRKNCNRCGHCQVVGLWTHLVAPRDIRRVHAAIWTHVSWVLLQTPETGYANFVFRSCDAIVTPCSDAWNRLIDRPWRIMSIGLRHCAQAGKKETAGAPR
ncbi:protein of unknown function [Rhodovastum atsumiense]|nr:protein of unknown function [Rhodovastum atsumiense]